MELGSHSCSAPLDHPDALLRRRYLRPYLSPASTVVLYTRVKFRPLKVIMATTTRHLFIIPPW